MTKTRIEHTVEVYIDPETNEERTRLVTVQYPVDNAYILARQSNTVLLSADSLNVAVNGSIQLSAQLRTPELADYSYQNLSDNLAIELRLGDVITSVNLVNGQWADTLQFVAAGTYLIECLSLPSNSLSVVVT